VLYLYDEAIKKDLERSFNPNNVPNPVVRVVEVDAAIGLAAQLQNDNITFPIVAVTRMPDHSIDKSRMNFTLAHRGVISVFDNKTNMIYRERIMPIKLTYTLTVLTTKTTDMDELMRELIFKYTSMYFLTIKLPYEASRKVRFGVRIDWDEGIQRKSGQLEYVASGQVYQSIITLQCDGCFLATYTPTKLRNLEVQVEPVVKS
jgi:hypothetical protein